MTHNPSGEHRRIGDADAVVLHRTYRAGIDDVWAAVTESDRLARWFGTYAGDPASGAVDVTMTAEGDDVEPSRWMIADCVPPRLLGVVSDGGTGWHLVLELVEVGGGTALSLTQFIDDPGIVESVGPGWEYYLDRLGAALAGTDPGAVDFDDYYPGQAGFYARLIPHADGPAR